MTYNAVLTDGHLEWIDTPPNYNPTEALNVEVEIISPQKSVLKSTPKDSQQSILQLLESIAQTDGASLAIKDPLTWQREIRQDRKLPGRNT